MFSEKVHIMDHPLVAHKLTIMRDKNTSVKDFRELVSEIGMLITYEATRDLPLTTKEVETPICKTVAPTLKGKKFAVVPILRAGLGLVDGVLRMVPGARVGHIGMFRDEETLEPHVYFCKMPKDIAERDIMIVDPMLATGGSAEAAIAEIYLLNDKGQRLSRESWKAVYADSESGNHTTDKLFDLQESTFWQSEPTARKPILLLIDLGSEQMVSGLDYLPRAEKGAPGSVSRLSVYIY